MKYLLGIDFGGGSSKVTLLDTHGNIAAQHAVEYPTAHPAPGACEQSPADWLSALCENTRAVLGAGFSASDILAVAIDSATHTAVLCDGEMTPLRPAIHWTDSRAQAEARELRAAAGERIFALTCHKPDTIWTLPQLLWLGRREPETMRALRHLFFEKDYIRYFLTGVWCTDYIEAEGSMLFDVTRGAWSAELAALCGVPVTALPPVVAPTDIVGAVTPGAAAKTGLLAGTPVVCGTTDTVMELFAAGAVGLGDTTVKLATAGRICVITDRAYPHRDLVNYSHIVKGLWYPGTATKAAASSLRWYRDTFGGNYKELDAAAAEIPVGAGGLLYHPYINGELTPFADPALCGSFTGIRSTHTKAHFTRAVLEGVALSLLHSKKTLAGIGVPAGHGAVLIGGGAKSPLWQKITADCLGMTLRLTESSDSSLGSAMLAGVAAGVFENPAAAAKRCVHETGTVTPDAENTAAYAKIFARYVRIAEALAPIYREETL